MAHSYPRYLTFKAGELEATLTRLGAPPAPAPALAEQGSGGGAAAIATGNGPGRKILVKSHTCPVSFIDGVAGRCRYTRGGPAWHVFQFEHGGGEETGFGPVPLPTVHWTRPLPINDIAAIEAKAKELAEEAYLRACLREQKEYFARASESPTRKKRPELFRMTAKRAKEIGGRYALCYRTDTGDGLIPIAPSCEHLAQANEQWREKRDLRTVVGCCNRLDRCWQLPRFNPLYAEFDPRPEVQQPETGKETQP